MSHDHDPASGKPVNTGHGNLSRPLLRLDDLQPGRPRRIAMDGGAVLLCLIENVVHAVQDTCPHEDISLSLGAVCEHRLRCPLHGSEFDLRTGQVLSEPAEQDLCVHEVQIVDGCVHIRID